MLENSSVCLGKDFFFIPVFWTSDLTSLFTFLQISMSVIMLMEDVIITAPTQWGATSVVVLWAMN